MVDETRTILMDSFEEEIMTNKKGESARYGGLEAVPLPLQM